MQATKIELFFLRNLINISLLGVAIILVTDIALTNYDSIAIIMDLVVLVAVLSSFICLRKKLYRMSVIIITAVPLATMYYHAYSFHDNTVPLTVILTIGFIYSILLRGKLMVIMHAITLTGLLCIFTLQSQNPQSYLKANANEIISMGITFFMLYMMVAFSAGTLKRRYDTINNELKAANHDLIEKTNEIETQNEELVQSQEKLHELTQFLEQTIDERTKRLIAQNERIVKYTYVNAHHVRGPVARVLGLAHLAKIDPTVDLKFLIEKITKEAEEIDSIISGINLELEKISE